MSNKANLWILAGLGVLTITGCATTAPTRNTDAELNSLNSRLSSMQGQLSDKDQQISKLQGELADQRAQLNQADADKSAMADKLDSALAELNAAKAKATVKKAAEESDLK